MGGSLIVARSRCDPGVGPDSLRAFAPNHHDLGSELRGGVINEWNAAKAGPTARSTARAPSAPSLLTAGSDATTIAHDIDPSGPTVHRPRQRVSTHLGPTSRGHGGPALGGTSQPRGHASGAGTQSHAQGAAPATQLGRERWELRLWRRGRAVHHSCAVASRAPSTKEANLAQMRLGCTRVRYGV